MRYVITPSHIHFFRKHSYIGFDQPLSVKGVLKECERYSPSDRHNLFQRSSLLRKIASSRKYGNIARELLGASHLRLLFDHAFLSKDPLPKDFEAPLQLSEGSSFQGLALLVLIQLSPTPSEIASDEKEPIFSEPIHQSIPLPQAEGDAVFFLPTAFLELKQEGSFSGNFLLIGYGDLDTVYKHSPSNPFASFEKNCLQRQGDKVTNQDGPLLF
ncbi:MAG: hypothetical protein AAGI90_03260 [Chlamydiota bacterium]